MKTPTIIAITVVSIVLLLACTDTTANHPSVEYSMLRDLTDSTMTMPDTDAVIADIGVDTNIWMSVDFRFSDVTDVSYMPYLHASLSKAGSRLTSSEFARKREVAAFKNKLAALLDSARHDTAGRRNSSIYLPMVAELTRLSSATASRKILTVFSDLMENTPELSFYDKRTFAQLVTDPEKVKTKLLTKAKLPNLTGVEVRFVYQPKDAKSDADFRRVSAFFKQVFEEAGAKVYISASLPN